MMEKKVWKIFPKQIFLSCDKCVAASERIHLKIKFI